MGFRELFAFKFVQGFLTPRNVITQKFFVTVIICISHWALRFIKTSSTWAYVSGGTVFMYRFVFVTCWKCLIFFIPSNIKTHLSINLFLTVCYYHVTYLFPSESTLYSSLNVKELLANNRRGIWILSDSNGTRTHNHLLRKRTLNHLAQLAKLVECSFTE